MNNIHVIIFGTNKNHQQYNFLKKEKQKGRREERKKERNKQREREPILHKRYFRER